MMTNKAILHALQDRTSIRVARRLLAKNGFPKGSGWDQIAEKLKDKHVAAKADYNGLQDALRELLIVGDKNLRVYKLKTAEAQALRDKIASVRIQQNSVFSSHFPLPVPGGVLKGLSAQPPTVVSKFNSNSATGLLFSTISIIEIREKISANKLGASIASDYEEFIGIKKEKVQTFDALLVSNKNNYAYVITDAYKDSSNHMKSALQSAMKHAINKIVKSDIIKDPVNIFPIIQPMYQSTSGFVKTLFWTSTSSSGKHEWMRGTGQCLRKEIAHKAAMGALGGGFTTYGIELDWTLAEVEGYTPQPMLSVLGLYRMLHEQSPHLGDAAIWGCATLDELEFTLKELMFHITGKKAI